MNEGRLGAIAGILFTVLLVVGVAVAADAPISDESDNEVIEYYEDSGNQTLHLISAYALVLAGLALLAFARLGLRDRLRGVMGSGAHAASDLGMLGFIFAAGGLAIGGLGIAAVAAGNSVQDAPVDPGSARFIIQVGYGGILVWAALASAFAIVAFSWAGQRTGVMPSWLVWLGYICAVVLLLAITFLPMIALPVWSLAASIWLLRKPAPETRSAEVLAT